MQINKTTHISINKPQTVTFVMTPKQDMTVTFEVASGIQAQVIGFVCANTPSKVFIHYILKEGSGVSQQLFVLAQEKTVEVSQTLQCTKPKGKGTFECVDIVKNKGKISHQARIVIDPGAQQCDTSLQMKGYLLDSTSQITLVPELDVLANDVKASHGASTVLLQEDQLFYLESRGLLKQQISGMMVESLLAQGMQSLSKAESKQLTSYLKPWIS